MTFPLRQPASLSHAAEGSIYTVGQCARILNVSTKTLRHYDAIGLVAPASVGGENQYRYYSRDQLPLLRRIVFLRDLGLGLAVIGELLRGGALDDPVRVHAILAEHAAAVRREIEAQRETLTRVERALALVAREGAAAPGAGAVVVKAVPEVRATGLRRVVRVGQMLALAREVERSLASPPLGPRIHVYYNEDFDPEQVDVEILYPVAGGDRVLPAATVAAILLVGLDDGAAVGAAYEAVYDWIEARGRRDVGPPREVLLVGPEQGKEPGEQVMELQVPIASANEEG